MRKKIQLPLTDEVARTLVAGDLVHLSGTLYTGRDAAHGRLVESIARDEELPFDLQDAVIYYVGPAPHRPGQIIGSCGPTTSYRMDDLTIPLLERGLRGMIGKGSRSPAVRETMVAYGAVYFAAIGGAGALIAETVKSSEVIAYEDLGPEAIRRLEVVDFPAIVVNDSFGGDLYTSERKKYEKV